MRKFVLLIAVLPMTCFGWNTSTSTMQPNSFGGGYTVYTYGTDGPSTTTIKPKAFGGGYTIDSYGW